MNVREFKKIGLVVVTLTFDLADDLCMWAWRTKYFAVWTTTKKYFQATFRTELLRMFHPWRVNSSVQWPGCYFLLLKYYFYDDLNNLMAMVIKCSIDPNNYFHFNLSLMTKHPHDDRYFLHSNNARISSSFSIFQIIFHSPFPLLFIRQIETVNKLNYFRISANMGNGNRTKVHSVTPLEASTMLGWMFATASAAVGWVGLAAVELMRRQSKMHWAAAPETEVEIRNRLRTSNWIRSWLTGGIKRSLLSDADQFLLSSTDRRGLR